jgi:hypothetical protein
MKVMITKFSLIGKAAGKEEEAMVNISVPEIYDGEYVFFDNGVTGFKIPIEVFKGILS